MYFKGILFIAIVLVLSQFCFAKLENGKTYQLKNGIDKSLRGYLTAVNNGKLCKKRGDVITMRRRGNGTRAQEWTYHANKHGDSYLVGEFGNEVTLENKKPFCNTVVQPYKITHLKGDRYRIVNKNTKKCLTARGSRERITWKKCVRVFGKAKKQRWTFIKVH